MARSSSEAVRHQLEKLWDAVQQSEDARVTKDTLLSLGIRRCGLDLEIQPEEQTSSETPILLSLLPEDQLDDHPIDYVQYEKENSLKGLLSFEDYLPSIGRDSYNHGRRAARTKAFVHYWASQAERVGFPYREGPGHDQVLLCLANKVGWDNISLPHPWYLFAQFSHFARSRARQTQCTVGPILEWQDKVQNNVSKFAHLTIFAENWCTGNDDSIQMGELKAIISGMNSRSKQLDIPEDQQDAQSTRDEMLNKWYSLAFPDENRFPVVLVSFLGPQHGRIFYASMNKKKLVIRQSKLYSFEHKATAPFNLFTRWILYTPLAEDP